MAILYYWARCSTCRQLRERIHQAGLKVHERDFFAKPLTPAELDELIRLAGGVDEVFSNHSPSARALEGRRAAMTERELREEMLSEPRLIRRPMLVTDDGVLHIGRRALEACPG